MGIKQDWLNPDVTIMQMVNRYDMATHRIKKYARAMGWGKKATNKKRSKGRPSCKRCQHLKHCQTNPPILPCEKMLDFEQGEVDNEPVYIISASGNLRINQQ